MAERSKFREQGPAQKARGLKSQKTSRRPVALSRRNVSPGWLKSRRRRLPTQRLFSQLLIFLRRRGLGDGLFRCGGNVRVGIFCKPIVGRLEHVNTHRRPVLHALVDVFDALGRVETCEKVSKSSRRIQAHHALGVSPVSEVRGFRGRLADRGAAPAAQDAYYEYATHNRKVAGIPHVT
jgi:hypothetical protein